MKRILITLCVANLLVSCGTLQLTGTYPNPHHFGYSEFSYDQVWSKVIDYFAMEGIPIETIDKSSGLIVSSKMSFKDVHTKEVKGVPLNPDAYVVIPSVLGYGIYDWTMDGNWNVRIKESDGRISINVNIVNLNCYGNHQNSIIQVPIKSTGKFESKLLDYLTK